MIINHLDTKPDIPVTTKGLRCRIGWHATQDYLWPFRREYEDRIEVGHHGAGICTRCGEHQYSYFHFNYPVTSQWKEE